MSTPVQTAVGAFVWHDLGSSDPEKAQQFYTTLFGWRAEATKVGEHDYTTLVANGQPHGGLWPPSDAPDAWVGHVLVDDVDATADRAKAAGGSVLTGPMDVPDGGRFAIISDPQGAVFSAYKPGSSWSPAEGVFVWDELQTKDIEGAKSFYGDVFGWTYADQDMGGGFTYTMFRSGDTDRAGANPLPPDSQTPTHWLTYIGTSDVDATVAKARELGATVYMEPMDIPEVGRFAVLADATGAAFGLWKGTSGN